MNIPATKRIIKEWGINRVSEIWVGEDGFVYKRQPKYLCENEWYALNTLRKTGFVPEAWRVDDEVIKMELLVKWAKPTYLESKFTANCKKFMNVLHSIGLRHGDLTPPHIFYIEHRPVVIDWGESRIWDDPRPDKRIEGDDYWMAMSLEAILNE
jgi:RIO-like serine/threonine protein kinase